VHDATENDYFKYQSLFNALSDFPTHTLASPRNREVVNKIIESSSKGNFKNTFSETTRVYTENYHDAISSVWEDPAPGSDNYKHQAAFKHNAANVGAYKAHRISDELIKAESKEDRQKLVKRYNQYQAVEYNAMTARCRTARQMLGFEDTKDLYPNLEWIRSRSANPREAHLRLVGLVLPINHEFWQDNQPGNLYGCKCDWHQTDAAPAQRTPKSVPPSPGLDGNPLNTGKLITRKHSYFKKAVKKDVNHAIHDLPDDAKWLEFELQGKPVKAHMLHDSGELKKNMQITNDLVNSSNKIKSVELLPEVHKDDFDIKKSYYPKSFKFKDKNKNPDATITLTNNRKWVADFKEIGSHLGANLGVASKQADYAIIKLKKGYEPSDKMIKDNVTSKVKSGEIKGAIVFNDKSEVKYAHPAHIITTAK